MGLLTQPISCIGLPVCTVPLWNAAGALPIGVAYIPFGPATGLTQPVSRAAAAQAMPRMRVRVESL